ncbi:DUF4230 domain-containing protein [Dysgonomonas sp. 216]|uniref:DUF4230 domain-containing protein n=1 Tax=Dysgonomonas sp. 216 TaxID=2302934 RepID=UPI0013D3935D|nr:DUF4230 domain-containing protein [Dysgonomonas sp. 216]NDW19696.1 DUF4230 domain-containing protein [Dysgonomonas sp. 216]
MKFSAKLFLGLVILIVIAIALLVFRGTNKTEQFEVRHDAILTQVEELGRLELVRYNIRDIVEYKKIRQWLPNSKTALIVVGEVTACVDLTKIEKEDINVVGDSVHITLPIPEICHFKIDHSQSRVYDVQFGLLETSRLVDEAYRVAEKQIYNHALEMGIANESRASAEKLLVPLLKALGFKKVSIDFSELNKYKQSQEQENTKLLLPK